jgi:hypothetical protein
MTDPTPVEDAALAVATIEGKLLDIGERIEQNTKQRASLSFAAHAGDDAQARQALGDLPDEAVRLGHQREDLQAALAVGKARHQAAIEAEAREAERAAAVQVDQLFDDLTKAYRAADRALAAWAQAITAAGELHVCIRQLGCQHVATRLPFDIERRALSTVLQETQVWRGQFDHQALTHGAKIGSLADVAVTWHSAARQAPHGWLFRRLGEPPASEAAE